jgi:hypothetical protein
MRERERKTGAREGGKGKERRKEGGGKERREKERLQSLGIGAAQRGEVSDFTGHTRFFHTESVAVCNPLFFPSP